MQDNFPDLTSTEKRRMGELLEALRTSVESDVHPTSWLVDEQFADEFESRLLAQHIFMKSVVAQDSFDAAFIASARVAGRKVTPAPDGQRFWDVEVDGLKISLKSSKAKSLKHEKLHISKLTEAAWIQDCRTARMRMERVQNLFKEYVEIVSSIIQLRFFREPLIKSR